MATIKLNPLITDLRKKMGTNVFSKWKGTNYVRVYTAPRDRQSPGQVATRRAFANLVNIWKGLGRPLHEAWRQSAAGANMTGYNLFIADNFQAMKADRPLQLSRANHIDAVGGFTVTAGSRPGEVLCSFTDERDRNKVITLFTQELGKSAMSDALLASIIRHEVSSDASPVALRGLNAGARYAVYAVVSEGPFNSATRFSNSVATEITLPQV